MKCGIFATWATVCSGVFNLDVYMTCRCGIIICCAKILLFAFVTNCSSLLTTFLLFDPSRLERLQRIVNKIQMESEMCDGELSQLESLLQTVSPVLVWVAILNTGTMLGTSYNSKFNLITKHIFFFSVKFFVK